MTNLEALRRELKKLIDKARTEDLFKIISGTESLDLCDYCNKDECSGACFTGFSAWCEQEHEEPDDEATVYVYGGDCKDKLLRLLEPLQLHEAVTVEDLLKAGFTNYFEPILHKSWQIKQIDGYPVSFYIDIAKDSLKITEYTVLDEFFGQPHPCGKKEYEQIEQIINELVHKKILERC